MKPDVIIIMGVSGSGKTSVGKAVAAACDISFIDGDDLHPQANIKKMEQGLPLDDEDRSGWFNRIIDVATETIEAETGCLIACSALKRKYRDKLRGSIRLLRFIYLKASYERVYEQMSQRAHHFMPVDLLKTQFETLEEPEISEQDVITIAIADNVPDTVSAALKALQ